MFELPTERPDLIVVAGDWHANTNYATRVIRQSASREIDTILHLGDFGIYPNDRHGAAFLDSVERLCAESGMTIWVTPGNHEDWNYLDHLNAASPSADFHHVRDHIIVLRRGARFTVPPFHSLVFGSLGGAPSVNMHDLVPNISWFPTEAVTMGDVHRLVDAALTDRRGVDVLLAHDVCNRSTKIVERMLKTNPFGWPQSALDYAASSRSLLDHVRAELKPKAWLHGHYHVSEISQRDGTIFVALAHDGREPRLSTALLDTVNPSVYHDGIEFSLE